MSRVFVSEPVLSGHELLHLMHCVEKQQFSSGAKVKEFESQWAWLVGVQHAVACNNGTSALHLAMLALGIGPGDEVLVPDLTFVATANAVSYTGARPVFVDVDPHTWTMDPADAERKITPRTKGLIPVHLYGVPCPLARLWALAQAKGLWVVEDCAEAHGATYAGQVVGSQSLMAVWSFYGNKLLTMGEGGVLVTSDASLAARARLYRGQGMRPDAAPMDRFTHAVIGYNYRLTDLQAAIGLAQIQTLRARLGAHRLLAAIYREWADRHGMQTQREVRPDSVVLTESANWLCTIAFDSTARRNFVARVLAEDDIETRPVFTPMSKLPMYLSDPNPTAYSIASRGLSLPTHPKVPVDRVLGALDRAMLEGV